MKKIYYLLLLIPVCSFAQTKSKKITTPIVKTVKATDGFTIDGEIKGLADGTNISLLNGQTGAPDAETSIKANRFFFKGKLEAPDFKILLVDKKPPYLTLFLDNSKVKITGSKDAFDKSTITGSATNDDFVKFNAAIAPFQAAFGENAPNDPQLIAGGLKATEDFIKQNPSSLIAPLAIIRHSQLNDDPFEMEKLFHLLSAAAKSSSIGSYVAKQITDSKRNAIGTVLSDFTQADTTGAPMSLSSLRGKYVLIDFWASWCRPCRQENPNVVANFNKFKDKNFTVMGVSLDKAKPAWIEAIKMDELYWPQVSDLQGWSNAVAQQFQIQSIPQNFLIGPDGKILAKNLRGPALEQMLSKLLD